MNVAAGVSDRFMADSLSPRMWAPLEWLRAHPRAIDVIAIALSIAPPSIALVLAPPRLAWLAYVLLATTGVALWWRRARPLTVLVIVAACTAMSPLAQPGFGMIGLGPAVALFTVAALGTASRALLGYAVAVAVPIVMIAARMQLDSARITPTVVEPVLLVAMLLGMIVRSRAVQREALTALINARIEHAAVTERSRITAEMHDAVSHSITVMVALAGGARVGWQKHPERALEALNQLERVGANVLEEMHSILRVQRSGNTELHASIEASGHNLSSLPELVETFRAAGLPVTLTESGIPRPAHLTAADLTAQNAIYRVVQESLTNALRYARHATAVDVVVHRTGAEVQVTVTDDGAAGDSRQTIGAGLGLTAMAERATALGGSHTAGQLPGGGWRTDTHLPTHRPASCERDRT